MDLYKQITASKRDGELSNEELAELNNLSNKIKLKQSLEKKITKKAGTNYTDFIRHEDEINQLAQNLTLESLPDSDFSQQCALSN